MPSRKRLLKALATAPIMDLRNEIAFQVKGEPAAVLNVFDDRTLAAMVQNLTADRRKERQRKAANARAAA